MHKTFTCDFQILFTQINLCSKVNHCLFFIFICNLQSKRLVPLPFYFFLARICSATWLPWYLLRYSCDKSLNVVRAASWYNEPRVFPWRGELRVHVSFVKTTCPSSAQLELELNCCAKHFPLSLWKDYLKHTYS